jgi:hypothetical protein
MDGRGSNGRGSSNNPRFGPFGGGSLSGISIVMGPAGMPPPFSPHGTFRPAPGMVMMNIGPGPGAGLGRGGLVGMPLFHGHGHGGSGGSGEGSPFAGFGGGGGGGGGGGHMGMLGPGASLAMLLGALFAGAGGGSDDQLNAIAARIFAAYQTPSRPVARSVLETLPVVRISIILYVFSFQFLFPS